MGGAVSSYADLSRNEQLGRLVSKEVLQPSEPFWNSLFSFNLKQPQTNAEWAELEQSVEDLQKRFLLSNLKTGNFVSLLRVIQLRHQELRDSVLSENSLFLWQTCNALLIVRLVTRFMVERIKDEDVVAQFSVAVEDGDEEEEEGMLPQLLASLVELLVETPLLSHTYSLHLEASRLLVVLLSSALYSPGRPASQLTTWRELLTGRAAVLAVPLTCSLLSRYTEQAAAPVPAQPGSLVLGLASGMWSLLTLGYGGGGAEGGVDTPLADTSLALLLLLTNHATDPATSPNPYREALFSFGNAGGGGAVEEGGSDCLFRVEFPALYTCLAATLHTEEATLLLYLLLHRNTQFRNFVLAGSDIEQLVIPILQTLYTCTVSSEQSNNHHIYMSLIILLIASEEDLFNQTVHSIELRSQQVTWYTERAVSQLSLGGLLILVVIRTIQYNMLKMRDKYLHTNCLAALANMSSQFKELHPYVAQRIVSLFETLVKKHSRLVESLQAGPTTSGEEGGTEDGFDCVSEAVQDAAVLEEVLRMVLEIINSCIVHQAQHNPNLIYTLLYKREMFELAAKNPAFQDLMGNVTTVMTNMGSRLEQAEARQGCSLSVGEVQEIVRQGAAHFPTDRLTRLPDLKFKYVEEDQPEDFFIPYVWSLAQQKLFYWNPQHIKLFSS